MAENPPKKRKPSVRLLGDARENEKTKERGKRNASKKKVYLAEGYHPGVGEGRKKKEGGGEGGESKKNCGFSWDMGKTKAAEKGGGFPQERKLRGEHIQFREKGGKERGRPDWEEKRGIPKRRNRLVEKNALRCRRKLLETGTKKLKCTKGRGVFPPESVKKKTYTAKGLGKQSNLYGMARQQKIVAQSRPMSQPPRRKG